MKKKMYSTLLALLMVTGAMAQVSSTEISKRAEGMQMSSEPFLLKIAPLKANQLADNEVYVGYGNDAQPVLRMGVETYSLATYFDDMIIGKFVGDKVSKIQVCLGADVKALTVWLREELNGEPVFSQEIPAEKLTKGGWIEVELPAGQAYTIKEGGYYVGYTTTQRKVNNDDQKYYPIAASASGILQEKTMLLSDDGDKSWIDYTTAYISQKYILALGAQTAIVSDKHVDCDIVLSHFRSGSYFIQRDAKQETATVSFDGYVYNAGKEPIKKFDLTISAPGAETVTSPLEISGGGLTAGRGAILQGKIVVPTNTEKTDVNIKASNINDGNFVDGYEGNNTKVIDNIYFYDEAGEKIALVEMYTTAECPNCPYGHKVMEALPESSKRVLVAHHVGFGEDDFTLKESYPYMYEFGVTGAPNATINRMYLPEMGSAAFSIGYRNANEGADIVLENMDYTSGAYPAFATIKATPAYNKETRELTLTVTGKKENTKLFDVAMTKPCVNVFLTEDSLILAQRGGSAKYVHDHVLRAVLGGAWGKEVIWNGDTYSVEFKTTIDEEWDEENVNIVAFLSEENLNGRHLHSVMNATETTLDGKGTSISENSESGLQVGVRDRTIYVSGDYDDYSVYTVQGVLVENTQLDNGLYLVKINSGKKSIVRKVMVTI